MPQLAACTPLFHSIVVAFNVARHGTLYPTSGAASAAALIASFLLRISPSGIWAELLERNRGAELDRWIGAGRRPLGIVWVEVTTEQDEAESEAELEEIGRTGAEPSASRMSTLPSSGIVDGTGETGRAEVDCEALDGEMGLTRTELMLWVLRL
jgi:hypothetical protein